MRIAGSGSHGVIEAGLILQEAAAIYDDLNAHHVQSYGPEARSQAARSEVIISEGDIDYPKATQLDVLAATTQEALDRYVNDLKPDGLLLYDAELTPPERDGPSSAVPFIKVAADALERPGLVHVVVLGALVQATEVVSKAAIEAAVKDHVPRGGEGAFEEALRRGYDLV